MLDLTTLANLLRSTGLFKSRVLVIHNTHLYCIAMNLIVYKKAETSKEVMIKVLYLNKPEENRQGKSKQTC